VEIALEDDAPPVARGVAATLRRAAADPRLDRRLRRTQGVLALRSCKDPQAVTVRFYGDRAAVSGGAAADADVVITLDFDDPGGVDAPKPKVRGAARHPLLALTVSKVLEPTLGTWQEEAARFWAFAKDAPRVPRSVRVECTDDGREVLLGPGPAEFELLGPADVLVALFTGSTVLGQALLEGRLQAVGTFEQTSVLTGRSLAWVMGEGR
jgi:hypothetical protein